MNLFLSWSGEASLYVAQTLRDWLPKVLQALKPWMSHEDLQKGARWSPEIAQKLIETKAGIVCVVPDNVEAAWLAFEAGALAKTVERTLVCPYLVGLNKSDLQGPLAQFQATASTRDDTRRLIGTLNTALAEQGLSERQLDETFDVWWPKLEKDIAGLPATVTSPPRRGTPDMLEELLELARDTNRRQVGAVPLTEYSAGFHTTFRCYRGCSDTHKKRVGSKWERKLLSAG